MRWLEGLIGEDRTAGEAEPSEALTPSLSVVDRVQCSHLAQSERDLSALRELKEVLRGLLWAQEALGAAEVVSFTSFADELFGAVEATFFSPAWDSESPGLLVADVIQARGVPFQAVAIVGLAEGEFPAPRGRTPSCATRTGDVSGMDSVSSWSSRQPVPRRASSTRPSRARGTSCS